MPNHREVQGDEGEEEAIPYTFEDSLAFTNLELFRGYDEPIGLLKKLKTALGKDTLENASKDMFTNLKKGSKAEMALELLYLTEPNEVNRQPTLLMVSNGLKMPLTRGNWTLLPQDSAEVKDV